ncbi:protein CREG1-like, partial [Trifolium medium]|nr:protein CREG1-like [Trifolium medium]
MLQLGNLCTLYGILDSFASPPFFVSAHLLFSCYNRAMSLRISRHLANKLIFRQANMPCRVFYLRGFLSSFFLWSTIVTNNSWRCIRWSMGIGKFVGIHNGNIQVMGNVVSFSDGLPNQGTGIPYFYLTTLDP